MRSQPALASASMRALERRIAVAHRPIDHDGRIDRIDRGAELCRLGAGDGFQRRFVSLAIPDLLVVAAFDARPARQNDGVEHELPDQPLVLDHPGVAEKLPQVAPHRRRVGGVRRAEIDDQHADPPAARGRRRSCSMRAIASGRFMAVMPHIGSIAGRRRCVLEQPPDRNLHDHASPPHRHVWPCRRGRHAATAGLGGERARSPSS